MHFCYTARFLPAVVLFFAHAAPAHGQVTSNFTNGVLTVTSGPAGDNIVITQSIGDVKINGNDPDNGSAGTSFITRIVVNGNGGNDDIDLSAVNASFPSIASVRISGGDDNDVLLGSAKADSIFGDGGMDELRGSGGGDLFFGGPDDDLFLLTEVGDSLFGGPGNDEAWVPFDVNTVFEGEDDYDTMRFTGSTSEGDIILIEPAGAGRVVVRRLNAPMFNGNAGPTTERLVVNGAEGNDLITADTGLAGLITLELYGGDDDDTIIGGDGNDFISDFLGTNTLFGDGGHDTLFTAITAGGSLEGGSGTDSVIVFAGSAVSAPDSAGGKLIIGGVSIGGSEKVYIEHAATDNTSNPAICATSTLPIEITVGGLDGTDTMAPVATTAGEMLQIQEIGDDFLLGCNSGPGTVRAISFETLNVAMDDGDDIVATEGLKTTIQNLFGGPNTSAASKTMAGDELVIDAGGKDIVDLGGQVLIPGRLPIFYGEFEMVTVINALPVELIAFDAYALGNDVHLRWTTASETNNAGFDVETTFSVAESVAGEATWKSLGFVDGFGTTDHERSYEFTAADLAVGKHRFRLRQVDFDGAFEYGPEIEVEIGIDNVYALGSAYPNPVGYAAPSTFTLAVAQPQHVRVVLYDALGRTVDTLVDDLLAGGREYRLRISTTDLAPGHYFYRASSNRFEATRSLVVR